MKINNFSIEPLMTEKAINLAKNKIYSFVVGRQIKKTQIKIIIEKLYPVKVKEVRISLQKGQRKKIGRSRKEVVLPAKKIAYVKLKQGTIDLFSVS